MGPLCDGALQVLPQPGRSHVNQDALLYVIFVGGIPTGVELPPPDIPRYFVAVKQ